MPFLSTRYQRLKRRNAEPGGGAVRTLQEELLLCDGLQKQVVGQVWVIKCCFQFQDRRVDVCAKGAI